MIKLRSLKKSQLDLLGLLSKSGGRILKTHEGTSVSYTVEPGGKEIKEAIILPLIAKGLLQPDGDGLFPYVGQSQTYRLVL